MQGVALDPATGILTGGCDPRRDGYVRAGVGLRWGRATPWRDS